MINSHDRVEKNGRVISKLNHFPTEANDHLPMHADLKGAFKDLRPDEVSDCAIEVLNLEVSYSGIPALKDIYCHFPKKSVTAIMGPSGCGKSTLVRTLNRTLKLTPDARVEQGNVFIEGKKIYAKNIDPKAVRKYVGIIHQRPIVFPMSIMENVLFGALFFRELDGTPPQQYAEKYLARVGLLEEVSHRLHEPATKLSGGQQQRLCLARTLANHPSIILMDEPCSAIDPVATETIEKLIAELKRDYTIIVVTHNLQQARRISKQAILMVDGRIIEAGETERLFSKPRTKLASKFITGRMG